MKEVWTERDCARSYFKQQLKKVIVPEEYWESKATKRADFV